MTWGVHCGSGPIHMGQPWGLMSWWESNDIKVMTAQSASEVLMSESNCHTLCVLYTLHPCRCPLWVGNHQRATQGKRRGPYATGTCLKRCRSSGYQAPGTRHERGQAEEEWVLNFCGNTAFYSFLNPFSQPSFIAVLLACSVARGRGE